MSTLKAINLVHPSSANNNIVLAANGSTTVAGSIADSKGDVRDLPLNTQSSPYALVSSDAGKVVSTTANIFVASSIFTPGQAVSVFNSSSTTISIIANTNVLFRLAGQANSSNRLLAQNGVATIICFAANNFVLSGAGLT